MAVPPSATESAFISKKKSWPWTTLVDSHCAPQTPLTAEVLTAGDAFDLLSVAVVLVVLAADIPPAPHGVGAWEGEGAGGGLLEGGLLGGGILWATRVDEPRERRMRL